MMHSSPVTDPPLKCMHGLYWELCDQCPTPETHPVRTTLAQQPNLPQHIAWLKQFIGGMNEDNWKDMRLRAERQLEAMSATSTEAPAAEQGAKWPEQQVTNPDIANPTGVSYLDCLIHRVLDVQQNINFHANEEMSQSLCDAVTLLDEVETTLRIAAVSVTSTNEPVQRAGDTTLIERFDAWLAKKTNAEPIRNDMRALFRNVDDDDWAWLLSHLKDSERARFWKTIIADVRGAISAGPVTSTNNSPEQDRESDCKANPELTGHSRKERRERVPVSPANGPKHE